MNIHIQDTKTFKDLKESTLFSIEMGSKLYGLNDEQSDTDILCIYAPSFNQVLSFNKSIHQVQYKDTENNIDYVFTDINSFFWNLLNGDATINFEILHTEAYKNSDFGTVFNFLTSKLRTYSVIIAYLGFANRDIKYFWKEKSDRDKIKKLLHIERGFEFAKSIFNDYDNFSLINQELINRKKSYQSLHGKMLDEFCKTALETYSADIKSFRQEIVNKALEGKTISRFLDVNSQKEFDEALFHFSQRPDFLNKQKHFISMEHYYAVNENELTYSN